MANRGRRRTGAGPAVATTVLVVACGAAVLWGFGLWERSDERTTPSGTCTVTLGERTDTKTAEQTNNIALIVAGSIRHGLPARAGTIAIATAIQESSLRNIDYGDRDSVGLFQQRPSMGWGSVEEIMDPYYSTDKFYNSLKHLDGWQDMEVTVAAQRIQVSGFPDAYADHEEEGRLWASALTGHGGDVTCDLGDAEPATARALSERIAADFGPDTFDVQIADVNAGDTVLVGTSENPVREAALQQWAVAVASPERVVASTYGEHSWVRGEGEPPAGAGARIAIRTD